jgi:hypothetical protein
MRQLMLLLLVITSTASNQESIVLSNQQAYTVGSHFQWFKTDQSLEIEEVYQNPDRVWQSLPKGGTSLGILHQELWLRLSLTNQTLNRQWLLQFDSYHLRYLDVWFFYSDGRREHKLMGANLPVSSAREFWGREINTSFSLKQGESVEVFIRTRHLGQFDVAARVIPLRQGLAENTKNLGVQSLFYGFVVALIVYHLILYWGARDHTYLLYSVFLGSTLFLLAFVEGFLYLLFDRSIHLTHAISQTSVVWMALACLWFANCFLHFTEHSKWLRNLYRGLTLAGLGWVFGRFWLASDTFIIGALLFLLVVCSFVFVAGWMIGIRHQLADSRFMLGVWSLWLGWAVYLTLGAFNLFPFTLSTHWWIFKALFLAQFLALAWILMLRIKTQNQQREVAEAQNLAKTQLLSRVSHEMRTPLNGIMGVSNMLRPYLASEEGKRLNSIIQSCGHSLSSVVDDLLEVSKLSQQKFELQASETELRPFISELWQFFELQISEKNLTPQLHLSDDLPQYVLLDQQRIKKVLSNLLSNALKFTRDGSVELRVEYENSELMISVIDSGVGIDPVSARSIFEPFEQSSRSRDENSTGTGLGLYITKMIVEHMGGRIGFESKVDQGSRFYVSIPATKISSPSPRTEEDLRLRINRELNILVAEDNKVNFLVLNAILVKLGHRVVHCVNGKMAFERYIQSHQDIDLVFMDCEMPVMDGYEATRLIRQFEQENQLPQKPIIAVTAHVFDAHLERVKQCGMNHQINKPYTEEEIVAALAHFVVSGSADDVC